MRNHCYYETQLREYLKNPVDFTAFTYSVFIRIKKYQLAQFFN